ncbi:MAG: hypothetical protein HZA93_26240 [Verrucomicrobia bacterium]|nr:hypothetical protein [Verrucomicrobiota bacterium]
MVAQIFLAAFALGLLADQPFAIGNIGWFGWLLAPVALFNAAIVAVRLFRKRPVA